MSGTVAADPLSTTERPAKLAARTLHAVGHFHLDPLWLWDKSDGLERFRSTVRSALTLMDRNPDLTMAASSAGLYAYLRRVDPDLFEQLAAYVRAGRWEPVGGMWIEPDEHLLDGESYVRQLLLGQEFFARHFGHIATVAWSPDSFGRFAQLPRMLAGSGLRYFIFKRPERNQKALPEVFSWVASDGSALLTYHIHEYLTFGTSLPRLVRRVARDIRAPQRDGLVLFGVGNHGGGPTQENLDQLHRLQADPTLPPIVFDTPADFFHQLAARGGPFPVVYDDLDYATGRGVGTHAVLKAALRQTENLLGVAEATSSVRRASGASYPAEPLRRAWEQLAFNQFHDTACGTCIPEVYPAVLDELAEARSIARDVTLEAIHGLTNQIDIPFVPRSQPLVVFNPHGHPLRQFVIANVQMGELPPLAGDPLTTHLLLDAAGNEIPMQSITAQAMPRHRIGFVAEVPALGYTTYRLVPRPSEQAPAPEPALPMSQHVLENDRYRLTLDPASGGLASLWDKEHELEVLGSTGAYPLLVEDRVNAWGRPGLDRLITDATFRPVSITRTQHGPLLSALRVHSVLERSGVPTGSSLTQEFRLTRDLPGIEVRVRLAWHERHAALYLTFPLAIKQYTEATVEIPDATTLFPTLGTEAAGLSWADLTGESDYTDQGVRWWHGLTLANTAKYSYSFTDQGTSKTMCLLIARGNAFTYTPLDAAEQGIDASFVDDGVHDFTYTLYPHVGGWREALSHRRGAELNRPLLVVTESAHPGPRPRTDSFLHISHPGIALGALKQAEDGQALILRLYEAQGEETEDVQIEVFGSHFQAGFRPYQIKTFRLCGDGTVTETDLLERCQQ